MQKEKVVDFATHPTRLMKGNLLTTAAFEALIQITQDINAVLEALWVAKEEGLLNGESVSKAYYAFYQDFPDRALLLERLIAIHSESLSNLSKVITQERQKLPFSKDSEKMLSTAQEDLRLQEEKHKYTRRHVWQIVAKTIAEMELEKSMEV